MAELNCLEDIVYRRADMPLSDAQLKEIAGLIYDTDRYIYPAMFASRHEAETVLPRMIRAGDQMFRRENLFLAMNAGEIAGVLVWMRGPLKWNKNTYLKCGGRAPHIDRVAAEYFNLFEDTPEHMASMVRISVQKKLQRKHIGSQLMDLFMKEQQGPYQLFVLSDNTEALAFFRKNGFAIRETRPGFSLDYQVLPCFWMTR